MYLNACGGSLPGKARNKVKASSHLSSVLSSVQISPCEFAKSHVNLVWQQFVFSFHIVSIDRNCPFVWLHLMKLKLYICG